MFLLKVQWELLGLKAPVFSWVVSVALLAYCIWIYLKLRKESRDRGRVFSSAEKKLNSLRGRYPARPGTGIPRQVYDSIGEIFSGLPLLRPHWQSISSLIIRRADKNGEERFWISEEIGWDSRSGRPDGAIRAPVVGFVPPPFGASVSG